MSLLSTARPGRVGLTGRRVDIRGVVQGVGFRPWIYRIAVEHGLAGHVRNTTSGVAIDAFGPAEVLDAFVHCLETSPPPAAVIASP